MREAALIALFFVITWCLLVAVAVAIFWWRLQQHNRVSPTHSTAAPITWLWSPRQPARLHRRLRTAVFPLNLDQKPARRRAEAPPSLSVDGLRLELEQQAVDLDAQLFYASCQPRHHRRQVLWQLDQQVRDVERLSVRVSQLQRRPGAPASGWDGPTTRDSLQEISTRLRHLEEARAELSEIDRL